MKGLNVLLAAMLFCWADAALAQDQATTKMRIEGHLIFTNSSSISIRMEVSQCEDGCPTGETPGPARTASVDFTIFNADWSLPNASYKLPVRAINADNGQVLRQWEIEFKGDNLFSVGMLATGTPPNIDFRQINSKGGGMKRMSNAIERMFAAEAAKNVAGLRASLTRMRRHP